MNLAEEQLRIKHAYESLSRSQNGKIVLADIKRRWITGSAVDINSQHATTVRSAYRDVAQTIVNMAEIKLDD